MAGKIVSCSVAVSDTADRIPTGSEQDQSCPRHGRDTASLFKFRHAEPHRIAALTAAATVVMDRPETPLDSHYQGDPHPDSISQQIVRRHQ